jgi:hypothetical protein
VVPRVLIRQADNSLWIKTRITTNLTDYEKRDRYASMALRLRHYWHCSLYLYTYKANTSRASAHFTIIIPKNSETLSISNSRQMKYAELHRVMKQQAHHAYFHPPGWLLHWPTGGSRSFLGGGGGSSSSSCCSSNNTNNNNLLRSSNLTVQCHTRLEGCNNGDHSVLKMQYIPPQCR